MRVLCIGDVCSTAGTDYAIKIVPKLKKEYSCNAVIINGENSAIGNGTTVETAEALFSAGADIITGGNHSLRHRNFHTFLDENPFAIRPHNIPCDYGSGYALLDMGKRSLAVINLLGQVYLEGYKAENPFKVADELIERARLDGANAVIVDFHAEATSEKRALGFYLDGKVSAVFGTHTHIQTSDIQILNNGTGYITDIGMTGPKDSVLGVKKEIIIARLKDNDMHKFEFADTPCIISGCVFEIDDNTGKTCACQSFCV